MQDEVLAACVVVQTLVLYWLNMFECKRLVNVNGYVAQTKDIENKKMLDMFFMLYLALISTPEKRARVDRGINRILC
jgi:hypothetical protein